MDRTRLAQLGSVAVLGTVLGLSGCSSSPGLAAPPAATTPGVTASPTTSGAPSSSTVPSSVAQLLLGSGGPLDVSKLCDAVPAADVQKLFKAQGPTLTSFPGECVWAAGDANVTVDIYANDSNKKLYEGGGVSASTAAHLSGVGDLAQWAQPVPGATVPFLIAHKGTTSISVSPSLNVDQTTLTYTGSAPFFKVANASAMQYAAEEGQICNDIFAAAHA